MLFLSQSLSILTNFMRLLVGYDFIIHAFSEFFSDSIRLLVFM